MKIIVVSGGFDPVHSGHIHLFQHARSLGDRLVVGVNSDDWLVRKKNQAFMPWAERAGIVSALRPVDEVLSFDDTDGTACDLLAQVKARYPDDAVIFANGGDRTAKNIPEMAVAGVEFIFGIGGDYKANSSSWILSEWKAPKTTRSWGYYRVLHADGPEVKVKELTVDPGARLSMQRHQHRREFWFVSTGTATVNTLDAQGNIVTSGTYGPHESCWIAGQAWHQLCNLTDQPLRVIEIQYGSDCAESDIERLPE
jgi:cytidyltransferase-like protein